MKADRIASRSRRAAWCAGFILLAAFCLGPATVSAKVFLKVGILSSPRKLNPFSASDTWTRRLLGLVHQPLYRIDPETLSLIPWIAAARPELDSQGLTCTFRLRPMRWDDGSPFTAADVVFTAELFKRFRMPRYGDYWTFVDQVEALDAHRVRILLKKPMAIFHTRTLTSWVVQKRAWEPVRRKAEARLQEVLESELAAGKGRAEALETAVRRGRRLLQAHEVDKPVGLGPFRFVERKPGSYVLMERNPYFFGTHRSIAGRQLGPYVDRIILKVYDTLGTATLALTRGDIDFLWKGVSHALVEDLTAVPGIRLIMTLDRGYRYLGLNLRREPLSDPVFRRALAYLIDKDFIIRHILHHHGRRLDTVVPPGTPYYFNAHTPTYGEGMDRTQRTRAAYQLLTAAGYTWRRPPLDVQGSLQPAEELRLPGGVPLRPLTLLSGTAQYDTEAASSGQAIAQWLRQFGMSVTWVQMPFKTLLGRIRKTRDFDLFILGWRRLSVDPDYLRRFFHSSFSGPGQWNDTGYRNPDFDKLAELQSRAMDPRMRRRLVLDLQNRLMADLPVIPLFVPHTMVAVRTDRFTGWSEWGGEVGNIWTFCQLKPTSAWDAPHRLHR